MGWFDISNRNILPKELMSFTVPYKMFTEMDDGASKGCLATEAWGKIAERYDETNSLEDIK
jgi:hypothetical protein